MSIKPFIKLVQLAARAFYDDKTFKDNRPQSAKIDNRGIAVLVLDALTRRQWVREDDLARDLKLSLKQLRRILRFFEEEKFITRVHRKETTKGAKIHTAAVAATVDAHTGRDGQEKMKLHTHSYCCLDYAQIYDVVRYRLHQVKKKLKDELDNKNAIQEYVCPNCSRRYTSLDACRLVSFEDEYFHCENCNGQLVAESDKLAGQEIGDGDDKAMRRKKVRDLLQKLEVELKPLISQLSRVKDLQVPEFGTLQAWEVRVNASTRVSNDDSATDPSKLAYNAASMPFCGETKVEVTFSGVDHKDNVKTESGSAPLKVIPPWMIKEGMNLTKEQRGETRKDNMEADSIVTESLDDKKLIAKENSVKNNQEYLEAYYAALYHRQQEIEEATKREQELPNNSKTNDVVDFNYSERQVGMKSKRSDNEEVDDGVKWEEDTPAAVDATGEDNEDDIDWEEG